MSSDLLIRVAGHVVMAAILTAALWRWWRRAAVWPAGLAAAFWAALEWITADARLLFPFAMACAGAAAWRWRWPGAAAAGAVFLLLRALAGAPPAVLRTEALGVALCLAAALAARRGGAPAAAAAGSLAALAALLL